MDNDKVIRLVAGILSALTIYILLSSTVSYAGIPVDHSKNDDPRVGLSSVPNGLLSAFYDNYGQRLEWSDYDQFYNSIKQSGSVNLIDDLADTLYEEIYKDQVGREDFDEITGYKQWRGELPSRLASISGAAQERALDLASRGLDLAAKLVSEEKAGKLREKAESMRKADRGYETYTSLSDFQTEFLKNLLPYTAEQIAVSAPDIIIAAIGGAAALVVLIVIPEYWNMASDKN